MLLEITSKINRSERVIGMSALAWLQREQLRINEDPKDPGDPKGPRRDSRIIPDVTKRGYKTWQLVEDVEPDTKVAKGQRIALQNAAFRKHGRDTPFTKQGGY